MLIVIFWCLLFGAIITYLAYLADRQFGTDFVGGYKISDKPQEFRWSRTVTIEYGDNQSLVLEFEATDNYVYYSHFGTWSNKGFSEDVMDHAYDFVSRVVVRGCEGDSGRWIMPDEITGIVVSEVTKTPV